MEISTRSVGKMIVDMTIKTGSTTITEDICNMDGSIPLQFIQDLEDLIHGLKEHNEKYFSKEEENGYLNFEGRYLKVLDDSYIKHYPCIKGDYILFNHQNGDIQNWGNINTRSNYWGINVHLKKEFKLMPIGFKPDQL